MVRRSFRGVPRLRCRSPLMTPPEFKTLHAAGKISKKQTAPKARPK
jgi:hypothetical protein